MDCIRMRTRYIQIDGKLVDANEVAPEPRADYHVMGDIQPYQSMCDGSMVMGRRQHREHLKQHNVIEVGNETKHLKGYGNYRAPDPSRKEVLIREVQRAKDAQRRGEKYGPR